ncbi:MAG: hypothetical protein PHW31_00670 [Candidatus Pacebacteria bacterium]|nr:hypothetical protein [Candidatus Paceibacterota bacterium]
MAKNSKVFFIFFFSIIFIVIAISFYKYFILKDYYIKTQVECNPEKEKCFMAECDVSSDSECPENPSERINYYKIVEKKAFAIPLCDENSPDCLPFVCQEKKNCKEILCDEATKTDGAQCSNSKTFQ